LNWPVVSYTASGDEVTLGKHVSGRWPEQVFILAQVQSAVDLVSWLGYVSCVYTCLHVRQHSDSWSVCMCKHVARVHTCINTVKRVVHA